MKKKLVAFLVLIIAICSLFTACVTPEPQAADALTYNGVKVQVTETTEINVGNSEATYDFTEDFAVSAGFTMNVYVYGETEALNASSVNLNEGKNKFRLEVVYNSNASNKENFVVEITRTEKFNVFYKKVINGALSQDPAMATEQKEKGSTIAVPGTPELALGEVFEGWYKNSLCTAPATGNITINSETTLYAKISYKTYSVEVPSASMAEAGYVVTADASFAFNPNAELEVTVEVSPYYNSDDLVFKANGTNVSILFVKNMGTNVYTFRNKLSELDAMGVNLSGNTIEFTLEGNVPNTYVMAGPQTTLNEDGYVFEVGGEFEYSAGKDVEATLTVSDDYLADDLVITANGTDVTTLFNKSGNVYTLNATLEELVEAGVERLYHSDFFTKGIEFEVSGIVIGYKPLTVAAGTGYTSNVSADSVKVGETYTVTVTVSDHFEGTAVLSLNGTEVQATKNGKTYTYSGTMTADGANFTVSGVVATEYTITLVTSELSADVLEDCTINLNKTTGVYNDEYVVTVFIAEGYRLEITGFQIFVDGSSVRHEINDNGAYTYTYTGTIKGNHTVEVAGIKADGTTYTVAHYIEADNGNVTFEGTKYNKGANDSTTIFVANGAELTQEQINSAKYSEDKLPGYSFAKAVVDDQGTVINYYYTKNIYTIRFLNEDGSEISSASYKHGSAVSVPANPEKEAEGEIEFFFAGWTVKGDIVEVSRTATAAVDYTAKFTSSQKTYSFTLPLEGDQVGYTITADKTEGVLDEEFVLTLTVEDEYNKTPAVVRMGDEEITFVEGKYTGKFGANLGAVTVEVYQNVYNVTVPEASEMVGYTLNVPTTSGYTGTKIAFVLNLAQGYDECLADVVVKVDGEPIALSGNGEGSFTLTKDCTITVDGVVANEITYTITHVKQAANGNYGVSGETTELKYRGALEDATVLAEAKTYEGFDAPTTVERSGTNITLKYARKLYDVVFNNYDSSELKASQVRYDVALSAPAEPTRADDGETVYTFAGWSDGSEVYSTTQVNAMKASKNVTFTATFTEKVKEYTITLSSGAGYTLTEKNNKLTGTKAEEYTLVVTLDAEYTATAPTMTVGGETVELTKNSATEYVYTASYENADVVVIAVQNVYTASYEAVTGANVTVTPASGVKGTSYTVTVNVLAGYQENFDKVSVTVDGNNATANASDYSFTYTGTYSANVQIVVTGVEQDANNIVVQIYTQNKQLNGYEMTSSDVYVDEDRNFQASDIEAIEATVVEGFTIDKSKSENKVTSDNVYAIYFNRNDITVTYSVKGATSTETVKYGLAVASVPAAEDYEEGETVYTFVEWQVEGETFDLDSEITAPVTIVAVYDESVKTYAVEVPETDAFEVLDADTYEALGEFAMGDYFVFAIEIAEGDYSLPTKVMVGNVVVEDMGGYYEVEEVTADHIIDGKIVITVEGVAIKTYTVTIPETQEGYKMTVESTGNTKNSIVTLLVTANGDYDLSGMVVKANGTPLTEVATGEYQFTLTANTIVTVEGVKVNTYTVTGTESAGYTISDIATTHESGLYVKGATVTFKVNVDADYNRSLPVVRYAVTGSNAKLATKVSDGVYSLVIDGDTTISVEGLIKNVYTITGTPKIVNTTVEYKLLNSLTGATLYINEVRATTTSYLNLTVESGEATEIKYVANDGTILYKETITIEAGGANVELGNIYLGYYNLENFTAKADGQYSDPTVTTDGWMDKINGNFIAEYTVHTDNSAERKAEVEAKTFEKEVDGVMTVLPKGLETDPAYGFSMHSPAAGKWIQLMFHKGGIRITDNTHGFAFVALGDEALLPDTALNLAATKGLNIKMVRNGDYFYIYSEEELIFVASSVDGLTVVKDNTVNVTVQQNNNVKEQLAAIINQSDLRVSIVATLDGGNGKELHNRVTGFYYADLSDGVDTSYTRDFGTITFEDGYDVNDESSGGQYSVLWPNAANETDYKSVEDYDPETYISYLDLTDYAGVLDNRTIKLRFLSNNYINNFELNKALLYKREKGSEGAWIAVGDVYSDCTYDSNKNYYYVMSVENGWDYKFELDYANAAAQTGVGGVVKIAGAYAEGLNYRIYTRTIDGEQGNVVATGTTLASSVEGTEVLFVKYLKAGSYKFVLEGGATAYGVVYDFDVSGDQAQAGTLINLGTFDLEANVFGTNVIGATEVVYDTTSKENYTVTIMGANPNSSYLLEQDLGDGEMISYSMKFNDGGVDGRAHGLYGTTGNSYYNELNQDCDAYYKNAVDYDEFLTYAPDTGSASEPHRSSFLGLRSTGATLIYTNGEILGNSPFVDIVDQFAVAQNYNLTYDLAYYRVREAGVPWIYLLAKYGTDSTYSIIGKHEAGFTIDETTGAKTYKARSSLRLVISGIYGFYQNYSYRDLVWSNNTVANEQLFAKAKAANAPTGPVSKGYDAQGNVTYEATLLGNAGAYIGDVVGDKTKGIFTIEADLETYSICSAAEAYNVYGVALVDPATGKRVHMGPVMATNGRIYASVNSTGNGWDYRIGTPSIGGITTDSPAYVNFNSGATSADNKAKHYIKAVIEGDNWKLYAGSNAENAVLIYDGNILDAYMKGTTEGKHVWAESSAYYPLANQVAVGLYTFGDGTNYAKYYNVKAKYESYVDLNRPVYIEEILEYAQDKGVSLDEDSEYIVAIQNATTQEALQTARENAIDYIDFVSYKTTSLVDLEAWIRASHEGYTTTFSLAALDREAIENATSIEAIDQGVAIAKRNSAVEAAKVDFQIWYVDVDSQLTDLVGAGTISQDELNDARSDANALIESSTKFEEVLVNFENAKNIITGLLDSDLNTVKKGVYAEIDAVTADTTEYGQAELDAAKQVAKLAIGQLASAEEINEAKADVLATLNGVATKVSTVYATVSFKVDGNVVSTMSNVKYGSAITVANATKAKDAQYSYTFKAWAVDGKETVNVIADSIDATFDKTINSYTVTVSNGTGYTISSSIAEAQYGTEVVLTIVLEKAYSQSIPTVTYATGKAATLAEIDGRELTYKFNLDATANVVVTGVAVNTYELTINANIVRGQAFSAVTATAQVDLYVDGVKKHTNISDGTYSFDVGTGVHYYEFKVGETIVYKTAKFEISEGDADIENDVYVGYVGLSSTSYTIDEEGIHNNHLGESSPVLTDAEGNFLTIAAGADFVITATFVDGVNSTETDQGHGFRLSTGEETYTSQLYLRWIRKGFRIEYAGGTWDTKISEEGNVFRSSSLQGNNGTEHTITMLRYSNVIYLLHNGIVEAKIGGSSGFIGVTNQNPLSAVTTAANTTVANVATTLANNTITKVDSIVNFNAAAGKVQYTTYSEIAMGSGSAATAYIKALLKSNVDAYVASEINGIISGYTYTPTTSDYSSITNITAHLEVAEATAKTTIMNNAVAAFKTKAIAEAKAYAGGTIANSFLTDINNATTVKAVKVGLENAKKLVDASVTISGTVKSKDGNTAISGATVEIVVGSATFTTTTNSSGAYSVLAGCGDATVNVSASGYVPAAVPVAFNTPGTATQNIVLATNYFTSGNLTAVTVGATKKADASDYKDVDFDVYKIDNTEMTTGAILADGGTFSYTVQYHGASDGKRANGYNTSGGFDSTYWKNVVGGVGTVINGNGCVSTSDAYMPSTHKGGFWTKNANVFDFGNGKAEVITPNYDLIYGMMYARQGNIVKVYGAWGNAKFGITDGWTLIGTADISVNGYTTSTKAPVTLYFAHAAGYAVNLTVSNVEVTTNGAADVAANAWVNYGSEQESAYGGASRYTKTSSDQNHRYDIHLGLAQMSAKGAHMILKDTSFNTKAGVLTIETDVDVNLIDVTNNCEAFGISLYDGTNIININQMNQASGTLQIDTSKGGDGGANRVRLLSSRDTSWASNPDVADNYGVYYVNNDVIPAFGSRFQGNVQVTVDGTLVTMYWNDTMVLKIDMQEFYWSTSGTRLGESSGTAASLTTTFDWTKVRVGVRMYQDFPKDTTTYNKAHKVYFSNLTRTYAAN